MWRCEQGDGVGRLVRFGLAAAACLVLANCSSSDKFARRVDPRYGVSSSPRVVEPGEPVPKGGGTYRVGKPYMVGRPHLRSRRGRQLHAPRASRPGTATISTAARPPMARSSTCTRISAAHPTLPMPSYARVTNLDNGRSIIVRVNDRGPYHQQPRDRRLGHAPPSCSTSTATALARVRVEYVGRAPLEGSDDRMLMATLRRRPAGAGALAVLLASARPFVPTVRRGAALRGAMPMPPDRPFSPRRRRRPSASLPADAATGRGAPAGRSDGRVRRSRPASARTRARRRPCRPSRRPMHLRMRDRFAGLGHERPRPLLTGGIGTPERAVTSAPLFDSIAAIDRASADRVQERTCALP